MQSHQSLDLLWLCKTAKKKKSNIFLAHLQGQLRPLPQAANCWEPVTSYSPLLRLEEERGVEERRAKGLSISDMPPSGFAI